MKWKQKYHHVGYRYLQSISPIFLAPTHLAPRLNVHARDPFDNTNPLHTPAMATCRLNHDLPVLMFIEYMVDNQAQCRLVTPLPKNGGPRFLMHKKFSRVRLKYKT